MPVLVEHLLHIGVGLTDTYLANHLVREAGLIGDELAVARAMNASATAAVGSVTYVFWLLGLITGAVGTGATAIIARAIGGRHRRLASSVCGQAVTAAAVAGLIVGLGALMLASRLPVVFDLPEGARVFFADYLRLLGPAIPFTMLMFVCGSCLRGAGDTLTPAVAMIVVDIVNIVLSVGLVYGMFGLPALGFDGIAWGTLIAYVVGGLLLVAVLASGKGKLKLYLHRLRPHWTTMKRILRIGLPAGFEGLIHWIANFGVLFAVNGLGNVSAAAHVNTIRIESLSYMTGFAFATAASTMVGQALGRKDPKRAARSALLGMALGGASMGLLGVMFILFGRTLAGWMSSDPTTVDLTAQCLQITGFIQIPFAAALAFGGALRGAGDTFAVMIATLMSVIFVRFMGVMVVAKWLGLGLAAIWVVLSAELTVRGILMAVRFASGRWQAAKV